MFSPPNTIWPEVIRDQPHHRLRGGRFAGAAFADDAEGGAAADAEADAVDGVDLRRWTEHAAAAGREMHHEIVDVEQDVGGRSQAYIQAIAHGAIS
jgi:hypothetical protein